MTPFDHEIQFTDLHDGTAVDPVGLAERYAHPAPVAHDGDGPPAWVRANFVSSVDGAIAIDGRSGGLGSPGDKTVFHLLRSLCDVVLVGAGTARTEGYGGAVISAEDRRARAERGQGEIPPIAVVTGSGRIDPAGPLFTRAERPPVVLTTEQAPQANIDALADAGAEIIVAGTDSVGAAAAVTALAERGWGRILCEGGPHLFGSLIDADRVDELCATTSPHLVAGSGPRMAASPSGAAHRMRRAGLLGDGEGFLYGRWVRDRTQR